ncbi:hypothetical protein F441_14659 [Phytophthora nicotianae CJ01A1]|uniref:Uncharacterized protein n=1 Tax=Phytophthora nicotianae CJ01A1 TaxID=1317063 RepID=W2WFU2_PHYNI|nr:hypothetical protein F441_14659 [Phytophthora nicotianae CJ01A1]
MRKLRLIQMMLRSWSNFRSSYFKLESVAIR